MSGELLYERYKDALKRGHVASLRGRLDVALAAYAEAAAIAPDRATPHTSAGAALLRGKRPQDAFHHYAAALLLAPQDEGALLGRAQVLVDLGRRAEAADAFDTLADVRAEAGRLSDAVDAARRGLELAEGRQRRRTLERLIARLRATGPGEPGQLALERALHVLDGLAMFPAPALHQATTGGAAVDDGVPTGDGVVDVLSGAAGSNRAGIGAPVANPAPEVDHGVRQAFPTRQVSVPAAAIEGTRLAEAADVAIDRGEQGLAVDLLRGAAAAYRRAGWLDPALDACLRALGAAPADFAVHFVLGRVYRELGWSRLADDKLDRLGRLVELDGEVDLAGAVPVAVERTIAVAASRRRAGNVDAAIDACYVALSIAPDNVDLHLALVGLYLDRGWGSLADEKLDLLGRLASLDDDGWVAERVRQVRQARQLHRDHDHQDLVSATQG